jgi:hypothetical protein
MSRHFWQFAVILICAFGAWLPPARSEVTIDRKPTTVERRTFDPAHRPSEMPPLSAGEAALTQSQFDCAAEVDYRVTERRTEESGRCATSLRVQGLRITLNLKIIVWLPMNAPSTLIVHEEGHRQIDERVYEGSEQMAREITSQIDGASFTKSAADCATAEQLASQFAADRFCHDYLAAVGQRTGRVNDEYDNLTAHGTKSEPTQEEAIRRAFACEQSTRPAGLNGQSASKR